MRLEEATAGAYPDWLDDGLDMEHWVDGERRLEYVHAWEEMEE